jgi:hypothetical protein
MRNKVEKFGGPSLVRAFSDGFRVVSLLLKYQTNQERRTGMIIAPACSTYLGSVQQQHVNIILFARNTRQLPHHQNNELKVLARIDPNDWLIPEHELRCVAFALELFNSWLSACGLLAPFHASGSLLSSSQLPSLNNESCQMRRWTQLKA